VLHSYDVQVGPSNEIINVFGYQDIVGAGATESDLAGNFHIQVLPEIENVCHAAATFTHIEVFNVTNGTGYFDLILSPPESGVQTGDKMPTFVAWSYKYPRMLMGKRSGGKRFGPIAESSVSDGHVASGFVSAVNSLATQLATDINYGLTDTWKPVILERKPTGVFPWTYHDISGVLYEAVSTQNTRKK
jgi:hypothetical protein